MPKTIFFYCFYGFIWDFLAYPSVKSSKFSQHIVSSGIGILKTKKVGFVKALFLILQIYVLTLQKEKTGLVDFPEKQGATKAKYFLPVCQILGNFPKGNKRIVLLFALMLLS